MALMGNILQMKSIHNKFIDDVKKDVDTVSSYFRNKINEYYGIEHDEHVEREKRKKQRIEELNAKQI
jgi:hypothetical protein